MKTATKPTAVPKETSFAYGVEYQAQQLEKHRNRGTNHWVPRIRLAHDLVDRYVLPRFPGRKPGDLVVVDVGCSIGTMAIEFAQRGFRVFGIDFDAAALDIARNLCREEGVQADFICADISAWQAESGQRVDIALCFDIFEHLHDDELGALLRAVRRTLSANGCIVFYTYPTQYDYLIFGRPWLRVPLLPLARLPQVWFNRTLRAYASFIDVVLELMTGASYRDRIRKEAHCNPTTPDRLREILKRSGYDVVFLETAQLYPFMPKVQTWFKHQPAAHRNLYGIATPRSDANV